MAKDKDAIRERINKLKQEVLENAEAYLPKEVYKKEEKKLELSNLESFMDKDDLKEVPQDFAENFDAEPIPMEKLTKGEIIELLEARKVEHKKSWSKATLLELLETH